MNESSPKVSIILPTYNGAKYIRQSIDSCLNQTHKNIELIIVDDGSSDETSGIINSYKDNRIKCLKHDKNMGLPTALNTGFGRATGNYLTWTSDDNYFATETIEKMLYFLINKKCSFVYCNFYSFNDENPSKLKLVNLPEINALKNWNVIGACFLYSRKVKETIGDYDTDTFLAEDYDYWLRVSKIFDIEHYEEPIYYFREHSKSLTQSRFYEVRIVDILVRLKNEVLVVNNKTVDSLVDLIDEKERRFFLKNIITKALLSIKVKKILKNFKSGKLNFKEARIALIDNIMIDSFQKKIVKLLMMPKKMDRRD